MPECKYFRIFYQNGHGYIDKEEFKQMTRSKKITDRQLDLVFNISFFIAVHLREVMGKKSWGWKRQ